MNKQEKQTTHRHRQQYGGYQREGVSGLVKGVKYMAAEGDLTLGGGHTMPYIGDVS